MRLIPLFLASGMPLEVGFVTSQFCAGHISRVESCLTPLKQSRVDLVGQSV